MSTSKEPADAPPSYATATGSSTSSNTRPSHLEVPNATKIPTNKRRSMEDENRPLPDGWIRQFDSKENHQFFVNTRANPPRSIWHHPYDDDEYMKSLSSEERERIQESERELKERYDMDHTDDESSPSKPTANQSLPSRPSVSSTSGGKKSIGQKLKDKVTGSTHEERVEERRKREQEEQQYYEAHMRYRQAMQQAAITGQPQFFAKDKDGKDIYIEPPSAGYGGYGGGYGGGGYGYNPYSTGQYPNARFIRPPPQTYARPYGRGYGGGYGLPIAGGLLGGMMLGGLLF